MATTTSSARVALVTGGGNGVGRAVAEELARRGAVVVIVDAGVAVSGAPSDEPAAEAAAAAIVAEGGRAEAAAVSVTDAAAINDLVQRTVHDHGSLDVVVEAAGIVRSAPLADATDDDWRATFAVHLGGHLAVARAALPVMAGAGSGTLLHVTSGAGLTRITLDNPIYGSAKRAIAALTWALADAAPTGVVVNALSPIAATRMVTSRSTGQNRYGLDFGGMPPPEALAPVVAGLCSLDARWMQGRVVFTNGAEATVIDRPRVIELLDGASFASPRALDDALCATLGPAHERQATTGGAMPRLAIETPDPSDPSDASDAPQMHRARVLVDGDDATVAELRACGIDARRAVEPPGAHDTLGPDVDAVVVETRARANRSPDPERPSWAQVLDEHEPVTETVMRHVAWARATRRRDVSGPESALRVVHVVDATSTGGDTVAQAVAQLTRATPFPSMSIAVRRPTSPAQCAPLIAALVAGASGAQLAGAELELAGHWIGLRAHPMARVSVTFGGSPPADDWLPRLRDALGGQTSASSVTS